jgi:hypothetical protein
LENTLRAIADRESAVLLLAFGAQNLFILKHGVRLEAMAERPGHRTGCLARLFHNVLLEAAMGTVVILIVAVLGMQGWKIGYQRRLSSAPAPLSEDLVEKGL